MSDIIIEWINSHFPLAASTLGISGAGVGTFIGKNITDKKQNARIKVLEAKLSELSGKHGALSEKIIKIESGLALNQQGDGHLRESVEKLETEIRELRKDFKSDMDRINENLLKNAGR